MERTPEFLIWAVEYSCPVRGFQDGREPERTERQLRAAREVSEARREGRVFEGICVQAPHGFRETDALAVYGGLSVVEQACGGCQANVLSVGQHNFLAGCYGMVVLPQEAEGFHRAVDAAVPVGLTVTSPAWYGLWLESPLGSEQVKVTAEALQSAAEALPNEIDGLADLVVALEITHQQRLGLHVAVYPSGRVESSQWLLDLHCPRCKRTWANEDQRRCDACQYVSPPAPQKNRKARGQRPYFPLSRLLGAEQAASFLVRYEAFQATRGLPDRV